MSSQESEETTTERIVGGQDAPRGRFPYMCSLKRTRGEEHLCGGVLIKRDWVLTAAHCVDPNLPRGEHSPLVHVGAFLIDDQDAEILPAEKTVIHCNWTGNVLEGDDIALLKLSRRVREPVVRLPSERLVSFMGEKYHAIGWGRTGEGEGFARKLQMLPDLGYVPSDSCNSFREFRNRIDNKVICATSPRGDTCSGDSGGPLLEVNNVRDITEGDASRDLLVGLTSHGPEACKASNIPGVYTRVAKYRGWIDKVVRNDGEWNCEEDEIVDGTDSRRENAPAPEQSEEELESRLAECRALEERANEDRSIVDVLHFGGQFSSRPSCLSISSRRINCFIRTYNADLYHIAKLNDNFIAWEDVGDEIADGPECVSFNREHMACFALGFATADVRSLQWSRARGFGEWIDLGGIVLETPSCVMRYGDTIECFVRGTDNSPYRKRYVPETGAIGPYDRFAGTLLAPFSCGSWGGDFIDCIGPGTGFQVYHNRYVPGRNFSENWTPLGERSSLRSTVLHPNNVTVEAFITTLSGEMAHARFDGADWSPWTIVPVVIRSSPECIATASNRFHCFAIGAQGRMLHTEFDGSEWSEWRSSAQRFLDQPSCLVYSSTQIRCYTRDDRSALTELVYSLADF